MYEELLIDEKDFSWSVSRESLFNFCQRAYFYHYYGSSGGSEKFSKVELLYQLKKLQTSELWINSVCTQTLREFFYEDVQDFNIYKAAEKSFRRGTRSIALKEWRDDPQLLNVFELYYGHIEINQLIENSSKLLKAYCDNLLESGLVNYLKDIPYLNRKIIPLPASCNLGKIKIWTSPAIIWLEDGFLKFLTLTNSKFDRLKLLKTASIHKIFAFNRLRIQPERVVTLYFDLSNGETLNYCDDDINVSEVIENIKKSSTEMLSLSTDSNLNTEGNFPKNTSNCAKCRFNKYCNFVSQV
jgi:hypothetical protein